MNIFRIIRLPDIASLLNAIFGFSAILFASQGSYFVSVAMVFLAAAADGADGFLARRIGTSPLGIHIDSLADLISFGLAPVILAWLFFENLNIGGWTLGLWILGGVYLCCGILRLARFNVAPKDDQLFEGLPIPAAGMMVAVSVLFDEIYLTAFLIFILSALMVSNLPYSKVRSIKFLLPILLVAVVAALLCRNDIQSSVTLIFAVLLIYLVSPVVILCQQKMR
jgi:archaetidylserine synthase